MTQLFLKILNMSLSASWLILAVVLLRLVMKKPPKWMRVLLWGIVALRLLFPFSVKSAFSVIPSAETISREVLSGPRFDIQTGIPLVDNPVNVYLADHYFEGVTVAASHGAQVMTFLSVLWLTGAGILMAYAVISWFCLRRKVGTAVRLQERIYQSENVSSPFVLGILNPKIYLPFKISEQNLSYVIAHEQAHIQRRDHWWKPLGFLLLAIYWFNPLVWLAYSLLCRDIELACDEKVIQKMCSEQRADYTQALLACSVGHPMVFACPLAFGEVGVKERIRSVMNYRKPSFWIVLAATIACAAVAVCFLTDPADRTQQTDLQDATDLTRYRTEYIGDAPKVSHIAQLLPYPKDYRYSSIELQTRTEPYELIVALRGEGVVQREDFQNCAATAFDLIGNMGIISFRDAETEEMIASFTRADVEEKGNDELEASGSSNNSAAPSVSAGALTQQSAEETIAKILGTLTVHSDKTASFSLPQSLPVSEDGRTEMSVSMSATFSEAPGSYTVEKLLEDGTGWQGGENPHYLLDAEKGELVDVTLNVFYQRKLDDDAYQIYAQGSVSVSAPFSYDVPAGYTAPSVEVEQQGETVTLRYTLSDGSVPVLSFRLPKNVAATPGEGMQLLLTQNGGNMGSVSLYPFGADDEQTLQEMDPGESTLPMEIFSTVALSNHVGYEDYQVWRHSDTGAVATAKFVWQDLSSGENAVSIPWQEQDCVLAYDWSVMPCFVEIKLAQGLCSQGELMELAETVRLG